MWPYIKSFCCETSIIIYDIYKSIRMFFNILLIISALLIIFILKKYLRFRSLINKFPGKEGHPIFGDAWDYSTEADENFIKFRESYKTFGTSYRIWGIVGVAGVVITKPEHAEVLLSSFKYIKKSLAYNFLKPWLKTGLLTSTGKKWTERRKLLTPAFHFDMLKSLIQPLAEHNNSLITMLKKESLKDKTDVVPIISHVTLNLICAASMGVNIDNEDDLEAQSEYRKAIYGYNPIIQKRLTTPWLYLDFLYKFTSLYKYQEKILKVLHGFTGKLIKIRKDNSVENEFHDNDKYPKKQLALLDLLISAKKNGLIDDAGIQEEVDTFTFEGHDTISMALSFALLVLANEPEHQRRISQEIDELFKGSSRDATFQDLQNMPYLELCLKECLRLFPSVSMISRYIEEDVVLDDVYTIPAGTIVYVSIFDIHRDEKHFPEPEKFKPERFLPEHSKTRHPYSYIPFSAGPRNCIGQKYAMLELKSIVSCILRNFKMEPVDKISDLRLCLEMVLRSKHGIHVKFVPRS